MQKPKSCFARLSSILFTAMLISVFTFSDESHAVEWPTEKQCKSVVKTADSVIKGWCAAISRKAGNCLACHQAVVEPWPEGFPPGGNVGPPLVAMKARYPNKQELRAHIWDPTVRNPGTSMPPFGKHKLISEQEIDDIVDWLLSI